MSLTPIWNPNFFNSPYHQFFIAFGDTLSSGRQGESLKSLAKCLSVLTLNFLIQNLASFRSDSSGKRRKWGMGRGRAGGVGLGLTRRSGAWNLRGGGGVARPGPWRCVVKGIAMRFLYFQLCRLLAGRLRLKQRMEVYLSLARCSEISNVMNQLKKVCFRFEVANSCSH